tara:strand:+ start:53 stop:301 length:249 start_codon:yes stop_codon:yes gene_type:complete
MRIVVIVDVDPDTILDVVGGGCTLGEAVETAISNDLDHIGIDCAEAIEPDHEIYTYMDSDDQLNNSLSAQLIGAHIVKQLKK